MRKTKVKELAEQIRGVSYKPEDLRDSLDEDSVILLRANNISDGRINFDDVVYVDKRKVSKDQYLKMGDILICASSGSKALVGKAASVDFGKLCTFGAFCKVIRPKVGFERYLGVFFQSAVYRKKISEVAIGVNINNIRNEHIDDIELPLYSEKVNEDIVKRISVLQGMITKRKIELNGLDTLIKARFVEMFGDPVSNTLGWNIVEVGDVCFVTKLAGFEYTEYIKYQDHGDVVMVRGLNVKEKKLKLDDVYYIDAKVSDMLPRSQLKENDIVMTYVGVNIGDVALVDGYNRYHLAPNVAKISLNSYKMLNPIFFVNLLAFNKENYASNATNTAKQALNMDKIRKLQVMLPPIDLQNQFENFAKQVDKLKAAVQKSLDETQMLFDSLMQQYFG